MSETQPTLDCQACGAVVRFLTAEQAQQVADRPYNFIVYCFMHRGEREAQARRDGLL